MNTLSYYRITMHTHHVVTSAVFLSYPHSFKTFTPPILLVTPVLRSQEEVEAARAAAAPGWTGDIAWDEAVAAAMAEMPRGGEAQSDREARVLKSVLDADIVPESKLGKVRGMR